MVRFNKLLPRFSAGNRMGQRPSESGRHHHQSDEGFPTFEVTSYQCPMKCEGDKVYNTPGNCPVCNMRLIPKNESRHHSHHHHGCC